MENSYGLVNWEFKFNGTFPYHLALSLKTMLYNIQHEKPGFLLVWLSSLVALLSAVMVVFLVWIY